VSASGHDRFDERLEENRNRFLGECGGLAKRVASERQWAELLLFGTADQQREFDGGFSAPEVTVTAVDAADLVSESKDRLEPAIQEAVESLEAERQSRLVDEVLDEARGGGRGAVGRQETEAALAEGRVEKLVVDRSQADSLEPLVRNALETGAGIATVPPQVAEAFSPSGGVAAMLRY
jgi:peptide subunit release factor 1 (eRF1)